MKAKDIQKEINGREVILISLVGSRNYNAHHAGSDYDFKAFFLPSIEDLMNREDKTFRVEDKDKNYEVEFKDIRTMPKILNKSNINYTEILFSNDTWINPKYNDYIGGILLMRKEISFMNMPYWFDSCMGIHNNVRKAMCNEGRKSYNERLRYSPKEAAKALRVLRFLDKFARTLDFKHSITLDEPSRKYILDVIAGRFTLAEMTAGLEELKTVCELHKEFFKSKEVDAGTKLALKSTVFNLVKETLFKDLTNK